MPNTNRPKHEIQETLIERIAALETALDTNCTAFDNLIAQLEQRIEDLEATIDTLLPPGEKEQEDSPPGPYAPFPAPRPI